MALVELLMPKLGESVTEATILEWLKKEGDHIEEEESVLRVATDKVDSDVPSPYAGRLVKILYPVDAVVGILTPIAQIETSSSNESTATVIATTVSTVEKIPATNAVQTSSTSNPKDERFYSPLVLNMAREEGIGAEELARIDGTGQDGRVTKKDMVQYINNRKSTPTQETITVVVPVPQVQQEVVSPVVETKVTPQTASLPTIKAPLVVAGAQDEIIEMDRMRRLIADHMVMSKHVSPHVTSFVEVDVTNMVLWRNRIKATFQKREGESITFTPLFIEAVVKAIKAFPLINSSVDGTNIIVRKNINIGMAAATPSGNLIVPVLKNADHKNLIGLTKEVNDLAKRAKAGQLKPDETQGGTFTLSNVGSFGSLMGTPIINQPQVAILATGSIQKKPAVLETEFGDVIAIRHKMFMSMSYDHRIIDGALGGSFLKRVADLLEAFDPTREI